MRALAPRAARGGGTDGRADDNSSFQCPIFHKLTAPYSHEPVTPRVCVCVCLRSGHAADLLEHYLTVQFLHADFTWTA